MGLTGYGPTATDQPHIIERLVFGHIISLWFLADLMLPLPLYFHSSGCEHDAQKTGRGGGGGMYGRVLIWLEK